MSLFERLPSRRSFTLVELLVVLSVIVMLVAMILPITSFVSYKVKMAKRDAMLEKIKSALDEYRAEYGEYPINNGSEEERMRHYSDDFNTDPETNSPYTQTNLVTACTDVKRKLPSGETVKVNVYCVESMTFRKNREEDSDQFMDEVFVNWGLSYPLYSRPKQEGKKPFIDVPEEEIRYVAWKMDGSLGDTITEYGIKGFWVKRPIIVDPASYKQWIYDCKDGLTYELWLPEDWDPLKKGS